MRIASFLVNFYFRLQKYRRFVSIALALLLVFLLYFVLRNLQIQEDVSALFPQSSSLSKYNKLINNLGNDNKLYISLKYDSIKHDQEVVQQVMEQVNKELIDFKIPINQMVDIYKSQSINHGYQYLYDHFPLFLDSADYVYFDSVTSKKQLPTTVKNLWNQLNSPVLPIDPKWVLSDPFGFIPKKWQDFSSNFMPMQSNTRLKRAVSMAELSINMRELSQMIPLNKKLSAFEKDWNQNHPEFQLELFSTMMIGVANSEQIKKDTYLTMSIAVLLITVLLLWYYRSIKILIYFLLPAIFSFIVSLAIITLFKQEISAIALAAGVITFGIILDYSFHFFSHLKHTRSSTQTLSEICSPLLIGCFTTVLAFSGLQFTSSPILKDFGLFAALSLSVACLFTLFLLPQVINNEHINKIYTRYNSKNYLKDITVRHGAKLVLILTIVFLYFSFDVKFDANLAHLNYHPEHLKIKERNTIGINPMNEQKLYFIVGELQPEELKNQNYRLYQAFKQLKTKKLIKSMESDALFRLPNSVKQEKVVTWHAYWSEQLVRLKPAWNKQASARGLDTLIFSSFFDWVSQYELRPTSSFELEKLGLTTYADSTQTKQKYAVSGVTINKNNKEAIKRKISALFPGVFIYDRTEFLSDLTAQLSNDFNKIIIISSLLVFITLLIIYGRIELAIIIFLPMIISWIWILGIAAIFDIRFNFVNIVLVTFIFGLGDDFCIFIGDALLKKHISGKKPLQVYQKSIILSTITTIIGTGVLVFASHPALFSISIISVIGMVNILVVALIVEPILFNGIIFGRTNQNKAPLTAMDIIRTSLSFTYFFVGCILLHLLLLILIITPVQKLTKRKLLTGVLSKFTYSLIWMTPNVSFNVLGKGNLDPSTPTIYIANHSSFLDILILVSLHPKLLLVTNDWVNRSVFFGKFIRYAGYIWAAQGYEQNLHDIKKSIQQGFSIAIFPEGRRSDDGKIRRFHKGAFYLSEMLEMPIQPVLIHGAHEALSKHDFVVSKGQLKAKILPAITALDPNYGENYSQKAKLISKEFKSAYRQFEAFAQNKRYFLHQIGAHFLYKGPILEQYFTLKWRLEYSHYQQYHNLIGSRRKIVDLGCGYGFLAYYLTLRDQNRQILAVDYDQNKIELAAHIKSFPNIVFQNMDIRQVALDNQEVILLLDSLHYLDKEDQITLMKRAILGLSDNGILLIREGNSEDGHNHIKTIRTEKWSRILGFSKFNQAPYFLEKQIIVDLAHELNANIETEQHSKKTSNTLYIIRKNES